MVGNVISVDNGILLRKAQIEDAQELYDLIDSNRVHLSAVIRSSQITSVGDEREYLEKMSRPEEQAKRIGGLIEQDGVITGNVTMRFLDGPDQGTGEIGYFLAKSAEGSGTITKACRVLIRLAFDEHDIHRVNIRVTKSNKRSRAVAERLGFTLEGYLREAIQLDDGRHDVAMYSLLTHERDQL